MPAGTVIYQAVPDDLKFSVPLEGANLNVPQTFTSYDEGYLRDGSTQVSVLQVRNAQ